MKKVVFLISDYVFAAFLLMLSGFFGAHALMGHTPRESLNHLTSFTCPNYDAHSSIAQRPFYAIKYLPAEERRQRLASLEAWTSSIEDRCARTAHLAEIYRYSRGADRQERVNVLTETAPRAPY